MMDVLTCQKCGEDKHKDFEFGKKILLDSVNVCMKAYSSEFEKRNK